MINTKELKAKIKEYALETKAVEKASEYFEAWAKDEDSDMSSEYWEGFDTDPKNLKYLIRSIDLSINYIANQEYIAVRIEVEKPEKGGSQAVGVYSLFLDLDGNAFDDAFCF